MLDSWIDRPLSTPPTHAQNNFYKQKESNLYRVCEQDFAANQRLSSTEGVTLLKNNSTTSLISIYLKYSSKHHHLYCPPATPQPDHGGDKEAHERRECRGACRNHPSRRPPLPSTISSRASFARRACSMASTVLPSSRPRWRTTRI